VIDRRQQNYVASSGPCDQNVLPQLTDLLSAYSRRSTPEALGLLNVCPSLKGPRFDGDGLLPLPWKCMKRGRASIGEGLNFITTLDVLSMPA
jgi:hypothetical protein